MLKRRVKFVQLITGATSLGGGPNLFGGAGGTQPWWSTIFALDSDGRVWMWTGGGAVGWVEAGPPPEVDVLEMRAEE
jgi:hypothetical protein